MGQTTGGFVLDTLVRKKIEKLRRKEKDARMYAITGREWSTSGGVRKIGHDAVLDGE